MNTAPTSLRLIVEITPTTTLPKNLLQDIPVTETELNDLFVTNTANALWPMLRQLLNDDVFFVRGGAFTSLATFVASDKEIQADENTVELVSVIIRTLKYTYCDDWDMSVDIESIGIAPASPNDGRLDFTQTGELMLFGNLAALATSLSDDAEIKFVISIQRDGLPTCRVTANVDPNTDYPINKINIIEGRYGADSLSDGNKCVKGYCRVSDLNTLLQKLGKELVVKV